MQRIITLTLGLALSAAAFGQTTPKKVEEQELRQDIRAKRADDHKTVKEASRLHLKKAGTEHKYAVAHKKAMNHHAAQLSRRGVKHPVNRAKHQIHAHDEAKKYNG